jgi:hypothetical protein
VKATSKLRFIAVVALCYAAIGFLAVPTQASHVEPIFTKGNLTCAQLVPGTLELRVEPVADGSYSDGTLTVQIDVRETSQGQVFDWTSNIGVDAVFVKGGPDGNLYLYNPEATGDTGLHAPLNPQNNSFYGLSHLSFCYDVEPPTNTPTNTPTDTPTDTPTNTPTDTPTNTPTDTPTNTPTNTPTDTPTNTPTKTPTPTKTFTPTPQRLEGCTPGYWKQSQHFDSWTPTGYNPNQTLESVFDVPNSLGLDDQTLLQALNFNGGSGTAGASRILLRAAVAALLNAAHPDIDYPRSPAQVIADVNAALASNNRNTMLTLASALDADNNLGCPLN